MDIARTVRGREEATDDVTFERRFDVPDLINRNLAPVETTFGEQVVHLAGVGEVFRLVVEMQDATPFQVKVDAFAVSHLEENRPGLNGQPHGFHGVRPVVRDVREELGHPAHLVKRRRGVHEQRRIGLKHPLDAQMRIANPA